MLRWHTNWKMWIYHSLNLKSIHIRVRVNSSPIWSLLLLASNSKLEMHAGNLDITSHLQYWMILLACCHKTPFPLELKAFSHICCPVMLTKLTCKPIESASPWNGNKKPPEALCIRIGATETTQPNDRPWITVMHLRWSEALSLSLSLSKS